MLNKAKSNHVALTPPVVARSGNIYLAPLRAKVERLEAEIERCSGEFWPEGPRARRELKQAIKELAEAEASALLRLRHENVTVLPYRIDLGDEDRHFYCRELWLNGVRLTTEREDADCWALVALLQESIDRMLGIL